MIELPAFKAIRFNFDDCAEFYEYSQLLRKQQRWNYGIQSNRNEDKGESGNIVIWIVYKRADSWVTLYVQLCTYITGYNVYSDLLS